MMDETMRTFFWFGGSFFNKLEPLLLELGTINGKMPGISPISEISASEAGELTWWLPELDARLEKAGAAYCILDLQQARQNLLMAGGCAVSASARNLKALKRKEIEVVDPMSRPWDEAEKAIDSFAKVISKHFPGNRIILIQTPYPNYYLAGNNLREQQAYPVTEKHQQWMKDLENRFREKTGCHLVDVTRFYFYYKEAGRPLTDVIFEKECYEDVAARIRNILSGGSGEAERPDFVLSLDRYVNYYFTMQRKPQRIFLDEHRLLDRLVLSASDTFVRKRREELILLDSLNWNDPEKALNLMEKFNCGSELNRVFRAFWAVVNGKFAEESVDYALMIQNEVIPEELVKFLKETYAPAAGLLPAQISRYNAGFHFAKMRRMDTKPFTTALTVEKPTVIDVFGSCISRTLFNVVEHDFAVNNYWFHVPPFEHKNKPYQYNPALFGKKTRWTDRLVKQQFEGTIYQSIWQSRGEWLLIDLYALVSPNNFMIDGCLFGDFDHRISTRLKARKVDLFRDASILGDHDALLKALDPWLDVVKKKYGKKIILVDGQRMNHWIGDDDHIYAVEQPHGCNSFLERAGDYVCKKLNCYRISMGRHFLPDELGLMRNTPTHKENLGYIAAHDAVRYIVDRWPMQKTFDRYSGQIQMQHLERLVKQNSIAELEAALPLSELDKAVIRLGYDEMMEQHDALAALYDEYDWQKPLEAILRRVSPALAKRLRQAAKIPAEPTRKPELDYCEYPEENKVLYGGHEGTGLPVFPVIRAFKAAIDKDAIRITWKTAQSESVQIQRKTGDGPWQKIGESTTGAFTDRNTQPGTEYQYRLGVKVEHEGRNVWGGYTEPKNVLIGIGVPVLLSAVHMNGRNTLRWAKVEGANVYRIYRKADAKDRWQVCATVKADADETYCEASANPDGGEWYTVRAEGTVNGETVIGGHQAGLRADPL